MEKLHKLKNRLMDVLENDWAEEIMRKPSIGRGDIEMLHTFTDTIKNIDKICMLEENGGYSHANRGEHWVRGRYSHDGERDTDKDGGYSSRRDDRGRYSRNDGRSAMMEHLEMALNSANEQDRENIARFMRQLDNGR